MNSDSSGPEESTNIPSQPQETVPNAGKAPSPQPTPETVEKQAYEPNLKYEDPSTDVDRKGLLLSNEIEKFCEKDLLIRRKHYKPEHLRPAAYTLTVGSEYVDSSGKIKRMKDKEPFFYMEPNSIVYV